MTDGIGHRQHRQPECEGDTEKTDPEIGKPRRQDGGAAPTKYQPERAKEFGDNAPGHVIVHRCPPALTDFTLAVENAANKRSPMDMHQASDRLATAHHPLSEQHERVRTSCPAPVLSMCGGS